MKITFGAVLLVIVVLAILFFFLRTKTGKRLKLRASGTAAEAISKDASTPEGAKAYYNVAIEKKEEDLAKANVIYTQMLGKISNYEDQIRGYKKDLMKTEININSCVEKNDDEGAKVYLKEQQDLEEKVAIIKDALTGLKENAKLSARDAFRTKILFNTSQLLQKAEDASEIFDITATQLIKLLGRNLVVAPVEKKKNGIVQGTLYNAETGIKSEKVFNVKEQEILQWVLKNRKRAGAMTERFSEEPYLYLSIYAAQNRYGVIGIFIGQKPLDAFENSILLSILGECAMALDREQSAREKEEAAVMAKNEQLRVNLLRTISHDLRTPLTSILGNADSLISNFDALDEGMRKQIFSDIYEDAGWLIELVENLLALTKIEDGSVKLQLSDQVVEDVVREALRHVERRKNEHKITVDCGEDVLLARMDAKLIVQVLVNLINNAVKYTQTGSKIRITAGKEEKNVWIAVEDNGPGIPAECREHVFEMFYSGKNKVSDSRRSLGLGLALCRSIVNAHGGELVLRDCAPHGCHFRFTLPLSEVNLNE